MFKTMELDVSTDMSNPDAEFYIADCPFEVSELTQTSFDQVWLIGKCGSVTEDQVTRIFPESSNPTQEVAEAMVDISESSAGADDEDDENDTQ